MCPDKKDIMLAILIRRNQPRQKAFPSCAVFSWSSWAMKADLNEDLKRAQDLAKRPFM
jgi:hypothetical protein